VNRLEVRDAIVVAVVDVFKVANHVETSHDSHEMISGVHFAGTTSMRLCNIVSHSS
jgi:hypothetical protein